MDFIYTVPIVESCLSQDDCVIQIADALEHLQTVTTDVFKRINQRIDTNITRAQNIARRIEICNDKVNKLTGANKAIKIYSSAKYPGMDLCKNYVSVFDAKSVQNVPEKEIVVNKPIPFNEKESQDRLEFYHVKASNVDPLNRLMETPHPKRLGSLPDDVEFVNSLILSNRNEMIYGETTKLGYQKSSYSSVKSNPNKNEDTLQAAPYSIINREISLNKSVDAYLYSPLMGEVPELHVPQDLPHLTGIADDMKFYSETESVIAPSAGIASLPEKSNETKVESETPKVIHVPVPVEPKIVIEEKVVKTTATDLVPVVSSPPPPPPPPPVFETPKPKDATDSVADRSHPKSPMSANVPEGDGRANLMDAIRKAGGIGGAKLRAIQAEEEKPKPSAGGGNLMADLHAKLSMRRKGISGNKSNPAEGTILGAIYAMAPPVVEPPEDTTSNNSSDEDWD